MNVLLIIIVVVAVVMLFTGGLVNSLQFLLWVGFVLILIALVMFIVRAFSGRKGA